MSRVGNRQTHQVVAQDFRLGAGVTDCDAEEEEQAIQIAELVGEGLGAGVDGSRDGTGGLFVDEPRKVDEGESPTADSGCWLDW